MLTPIEREVAGLVALGYRNEWIGWRLDYSRDGVMNILRRVYNKFGWSHEVEDRGNRVKLAVLVARGEL